MHKTLSFPGGVSGISVKRAPGAPDPPPCEVDQRLKAFDLNTLFKPVKVCIYCRSTTYSENGGALRREHIVPESLGGNIRLPEASCRACERLINNFETFCAKQIFESFRYSLGIKGKRRERARRDARRTTEFVAFMKGGKANLESVSLRELPLRLYLPTPQVPGIMHNPPGGRSCVRRYAMFNFFGEQDLEEFRRRHGATHAAIPFSGQMRIEPFMRLIAKIAHGYAVGKLGVDGFEPLLLPVIRGDLEFNASHLIGTSRYKWTREGNYYLSINEEFHNSVKYWVCRIQLFPEYGLPEYIAFVGVPKGHSVHGLIPAQAEEGLRWGLPEADLRTDMSEWVERQLFLHPAPGEDDPALRLIYGMEPCIDELAQVLFAVRGNSREPE